MSNLDNSSSFRHQNPENRPPSDNFSGSPANSSFPERSAFPNGNGAGEHERKSYQSNLVRLLKQGLIVEACGLVQENSAAISADLIRELVTAASFTDPYPKPLQSFEERNRFADLAERDREALIKTLMLCARTLPDITKKECLKGVAGDNIYVIEVCRQVLKEPVLNINGTITALVQLSRYNDRSGLDALTMLQRLEELALPAIPGLLDKFAVCPFHSEKQIALKETIQSIGRHSPDYAIRCILRGLSNSRAAVRASALESLAAFELSDDVLFSAAYHLMDDRQTCQLAAIKCLLSAGSTKAAPFLPDLFRLTDREVPFKVKCAALEAIGQISKPDDHTFEIIRNEWQTVKKILYHRRSKPLGYNHSPDVKIDDYLKSIFTAVSSYYNRDRRCSAMLMEGQESSLVRVREAVAASLTHIDSFDFARKFFQKGLGDSSVEVRKKTVASASRHGTRAYNLLIIHFNEETDRGLRNELGGILKNLQGKV